MATISKFLFDTDFDAGTDPAATSRTEPLNRVRSIRSQRPCPFVTMVAIAASVVDAGTFVNTCTPSAVPSCDRTRTSTSLADTRRTFSIADCGGVRSMYTTRLKSLNTAGPPSRRWR